MSSRSNLTSICPMEKSKEVLKESVIAFYRISARAILCDKNPPPKAYTVFWAWRNALSDLGVNPETVQLC